MARFGRTYVVLSCALAVAACAGTKQKPSPGTDGGAGSGTSGVGGTTGGSAVGTGGSTGMAGIISVGGTTGTGGTGPCVPNQTCTPPGGQYCGTIGNGCPGQKLECGTCSGDSTCELNQCVGGPSCKPLACGSYCGEIGDGCGRKLTCAACTGGRECRGGICVDPGCVPMTCSASATVRYCGTIGDGCGGTLDCMTCPNGGTCGGPGYEANVCNDPTCPKFACKPTGGGQYCGVIGNGCGGTQDCGACDNGMACPTSGEQKGICPGATVMVPPTCTGATKTTISGVVYDPAGVNPLYNVIVYVPRGPLPTLTSGVSCDRCGAQVNAPYASALTDTQGRFTMTLEPVPMTTNVPVVMQIGKWRRQITIPSIQTCTNNAITDKNLTRLPRTFAEGNIPRIAVTTGAADALECLMRRIGLADTEFGVDGSAARVHLFEGGGGTNRFMTGGNFPSATTLWSSANKLSNYDIQVLSCEGSTSKYVDMKPQASIDNVANYVNGGGRLFVSHLHFYWLQKRPQDLATATGPFSVMDPVNDATLTVNQMFPKGAALAQWLNGPIVRASTTLGQITVSGSEHSVNSVNAPTSEWIYLPGTGAAHSTQYLSFNTPVAAPEAMQCGKVVFTDIHIQKSVGNAGGDDSDPDKPFPSGCKTNEMTAQAKALEFLFFDLTSCVEPPNTMPQPPIPQPPGGTAGPPPSVGKPPTIPPPPPPPPPPDPG